MECTTLDCVLTTVIHNNIFWIDTIYISGIIKIENEDIFIPHKISIAQRNLSIICLESYVLSSNLRIFARTFLRKFVLQLEGILFHNCTLSINNVHVVLSNVHFVDSLLTDDELARGDLGQVELHVSQVTFESQRERTASGLILDKLFTVSLFVLRSEFSQIATTISVPNLFLDISEISCVCCNIVLDNAMFSFIRFENMYLSPFCPSLPDVSMVRIVGFKLNAYFMNCVFENTTGLQISTKETGFFDSFIKITVQNSSFKKCMKFGGGGAISVSYFPHKLGLTRLSNFVKIINSTFSQNEVERIGLTVSQGGALHISSQATAGTCNLLSVEIDGSTFVNNKATDGGGALFISGECLALRVSNSFFEVTQYTFDSSQGVFIIAYSEVSILFSTFSKQFKDQSSSLVDLEMHSLMTNIRDLDITLQCPEWYNVALETKFVQHQARKTSIRCTACPASFYVPTDGNFLVALMPNQSIISAMAKTTKAEGLYCLPCPIGAQCPGNDLTASPNFWGSMSETKVQMFQCPTGYCCENNCTSYNQCLGHRTDVLCGSCEENYSLALLSTECLHESTCHDYWLWPIMILAVVLYLLWYTFKDNIFAVISWFTSIVHKCSSTHSDQKTIDKGYFGIVTYFVQIKAVLALSKPEGTTRTFAKILLETESYIQLVLNFELCYIYLP